MLINLDNFPNYTSNNLKKQFLFLLINKMYDVPNIVFKSEVAFVSEMKLVNNITDWVVDTRATRHICFSKELFLYYEEVIDEENVYLEDYGTTRVARRGKVLLKFTSGKSFALHFVLHVPNMCRNLVSGFLLNKAGLKIVFESYKIVLSQNGDFVGKGFCHEGLFVLETNCENMNISSNSFAYIAEYLDLWHGRLGHVNVAAIKRMKQMSLIPNLTNSEHSKCEICVEAKKFQKTFQNC